MLVLVSPRSLVYGVAWRRAAIRSTERRASLVIMPFSAGPFRGEVLTQTKLCDDLVRIELGGQGLAGFESTGLADEWVTLIPPGERAGRFYTVRSWSEGRMVIDIVVHDHGLVTDWAAGDCVGDTVTITAPKGSFVVPDDATWVFLVGDLTALAAMARACDDLNPGRTVRLWAEAPEPVADYFSPAVTDRLTWTAPEPEGESRLGELVETIEWPEGPGHFWMAGESSQMRAVRRHLVREMGWPHSAYNLMGYWRANHRTAR